MILSFLIMLSVSAAAHPLVSGSFVAGTQDIKSIVFVLEHVEFKQCEWEQMIQDLPFPLR
ncbi:MAG: hypothetical protein ACTSUH_06740 [Candidatus Thorarchaeota archaeon]